jgi:hypothetical protein
MYVSRLLERVRAALFGRRTPGRRSRPAAPTQAPVSSLRPTPEMWGAVLELARIRRAGRTPAPPDSHHDQGEVPALVRAYVLPPGERQYTLCARQLAEAGR